MGDGVAVHLTVVKLTLAGQGGFSPPTPGLSRVGFSETGSKRVDFGLKMADFDPETGLI